MFPAPSKTEEVEDGLVSYIPYSNGYDNGFEADIGTENTKDFISELKLKLKLVGSKTLSTIIHNLAARDRPVTCLIYMMSWAADVAHDHGISSAIYWIQLATVFAVYYHYFHGYDELISSHSQDHGLSGTAAAPNP
ncbi:putative Cyanidin 3-O-rutinoside 5-O-glucosyltransferase [Cocos nucifera]|uniref:Putative Cyanidin 3-O-rutinoside 5-O-glucosyltransferase n=1 Tax=Cocos nucifera TaxID=13894 RepID=A0A8K0MYA3_COCNU|nr:putative Cyanidin 3-O-rutinoside 5-O-glucosyltransferase [Cocos nucifera]